ncbi:unnamed protein product, partial [Gongylonema pulchrum]|uniref:Uncharacterized protein n=1 Tax=Gongylonema pulchrum TaxID=637853 RepID=A0A183EGC3_9BILA
MPGDQSIKEASVCLYKLLIWRAFDLLIAQLRDRECVRERVAVELDEEGDRVREYDDRLEESDDRGTDNEFVRERDRDRGERERLLVADRVMLRFEDDRRDAREVSERVRERLRLY